MPLLLGIDLGTSYFKVGSFDETGALRGLGRVPVRKTSPAPGRSELAVEDFWRMLRDGLATALNEARAAPGEIAAMSYSSQASTFLLLDQNDAPLTPFIVWTDQRGDAVRDELAAFAQGGEFRETIGYRGVSGQSAPAKWRWFAHHKPALWARARRIMTISDYLTFALTGERAGDASTAAFLAIYDLRRGRWWPEALRAFGVETKQLSTPLRPGAPCGRTTARAAELLGVPAGIPFAAGALDHHAAAIGSGLGRLAEASISTGTVLAALALVDEPVPQENCYHGRHVDGARYWRLAFDPRGAGQLEDYQRQHAPQRTIDELLSLAARVTSGVAWRPGPTADPGSAVRAMLERVAATQRGLVRSIVGRDGAARVIATGGGARSPLWLQITADVLGVPVVTSLSPERACLGAATFAAAAAGLYSTIDDAAAAMVRADRVYEPNPADAAVYRSLLS